MVESLGETQLLKKYEGLKLFDPECGIMFDVQSFNLEFKRLRGSCGWDILLAPPCLYS
jgi:hypothetical protein